VPAVWIEQTTYRFQPIDLPPRYAGHAERSTILDGAAAPVKRGQRRLRVVSYNGMYVRLVSRRRLQGQPDTRGRLPRRPCARHGVGEGRLKQLRVIDSVAAERHRTV
jgi:hypothetical protein